jgi:gamma-glutamyl:cysteine ligase YbdK (ATP-grasp superfamily)
LFDDPPENFAHLRLHNGTIWRWNRPLIGFNAQGKPHLRIEHRVIPAGPSIIDTIANTALFIGMIEALIRKKSPPLEWNMPFYLAQRNFYAAARWGLEAELHWFDGERGKASALFLERLLPLAQAGLEHLEINQDDIQYYLGIIQRRIATGQTGAYWQRRYVAAHGYDMNALTATYAEWQRRGNPVHEWTV